MTERIGKAPACHQDPSHSSAWCTVHDECPDWHSELRGYVGPAGWVCNSGGMAFDTKLGEVAYVAYVKGQENARSDQSGVMAERDAAVSMGTQLERERDRLRGQVATLREALDSIRSVMATTSRDWSTERDLAWCWAIAWGWGEALAQTAARLHWGENALARLRRVSAAVNAIFELGDAPIREAPVLPDEAP